jgi:AraC-like DNA-binding protein
VADLTGQSPLVWLREQRLLRVRKLIGSRTCKTLAEAGARCGLDNPAYLYRIYWARFGES